MEQLVRVFPICLNDAMQPDFEHTTLNLATDPHLYNLIKKIEACIKSWDQHTEPLMPSEIAWYNDLNSLAKSIRTTLNRRYGCND